MSEETVHCIGVATISLWIDRILHHLGRIRPYEHRDEPFKAIAEGAGKLRFARLQP